VSELVALLDPDDDAGRQVGVAPRDRVRRENLPHAATAVLVRRPTGELFVHRRSTAKDVWPGWHDCTAGGVMLAGEQPEPAARRELVEELGIDGSVLVPLVRRWYHDDRVWYLAFCYVTEWDGPVRFTDGEVADGWWEPPSRLYTRLDDPTWLLVPDARALLEMPAVRHLLLTPE
jgi:8-oxo-dGTP pyrophosphatase MutT (NUDIX family)